MGNGVPFDTLYPHQFASISKERGYRIFILQRVDFKGHACWLSKTAGETRLPRKAGASSRTPNGVPYGVNYSIRQLKVKGEKEFRLEGKAELVGQGWEGGVRKGARAGEEFRRDGKSRTKDFIEGCQKPLKPKKYISFIA